MKRILFALSLMAATTASFAQVAKPMEDVKKRLPQYKIRYRERSTYHFITI